MEPLKLLIVDDETEVAKSLRRDLKRLGFSGEILLSNGYHEALSQGKVDILITDQRMPDKDGMTLVKQIRVTYPETICIMMSGYSDFDIVVNGLNEGKIAGFIVKPWDDSLLVQLINRAEESLFHQRVVNYYTKMNVWDKSAWEDGIKKFAQVEPSINKKHISALSNLIKAKDEALYHHSRRVADTCKRFAGYLHLSTEEVEEIELGALAHDIGKVAILDEIHYKPGKLEKDEYLQMKKHAEIGADLLRELGISETIVAIVAQHHEHFDGSGYPIGLMEEAIILPARILSIIDAYDALTSDRIYRKGYSADDALMILQNNVGKIYDSTVFSAFMNWVKESNLVMY